MIVTSSANDKLTSLRLNISSITLTSQSGTTVTLQNQPQQVELVHLNGIAEPLLSTNVPQGVYTGASIAFSAASFSYVFLDTGNSIHNVIPAVGPGVATVNLATPITISGTAMALSLSMPISQSANYSGAPLQDDMITPVFNLAPLSLANPPMNGENGLMQDINGRVTSTNIAGNSFTLSTADGAALTVNAASSTAYDGIQGLPQLANGEFVNLDAALQPDNSLLATRVEVRDAIATDYGIGPLIQSAPAGYLAVNLARTGGTDAVFVGLHGSTVTFSYPANAVFQISGQYSAPQGAGPFSFTSTNMAPGQNVSVTLDTFTDTGYSVAATVTLVPQTVDGMIQSCVAPNSAGAPESCTVTLASYDAISTFAGASSIEVISTTDTQMLSGASLVAGATARFHGFLFSSNGMLVMVCDQVNSGVPV